MHAVVADEAEFPESVHKEAHPRTGRPHYFCQSLLTQTGYWEIKHSFFAEMRHRQKDSRQPFFADVEKLIDQIILIADDALQQILDKGDRQWWLPIHGQHHRLLFDMQKDAVSHGSCGRHAYKLSSKTTLSKEIVFSQNGKSRFLSAFRFNAQPQVPLLDKEQSVRSISLSEDCAISGEGKHLPTLPNGGEEDMGIETTGCVLACHLLHRGVVEAHLNFVAVNYGEGDESPLVNIAHGIRGEKAQPPQNWRGVFLRRAVRYPA
jgi:hypothetical protein